MGLKPLGAAKTKTGKGVRILGIDPGYARCGWGLVEIFGNQLRADHFGVIETSKNMALPQRLVLLHHELQALIRQWAPDETAVEQLFFAKNAKTAIDVGQARGVLVLTCAEAGLPVAEYKPAEIKLAVCGHGMAVKTQVQRMVCLLLALHEAPKLDDAADALAVAICHANSRKLKNIADRMPS